LTDQNVDNVLAFKSGDWSLDSHISARFEPLRNPKQGLKITPPWADCHLGERKEKKNERRSRITEGKSRLGKRGKGKGRPMRRCFRKGSSICKFF